MWYLELMKVLGSFVTLTLLCEYTQDIEEGSRTRLLPTGMPYTTQRNNVIAYNGFGARWGELSHTVGSD